MIKALILEDTIDNRDTLIRTLQVDCSEIELVGTAETVAEAYALYKKYLPELLFLDINLDKETSFDLLLKLKQEELTNYEVIFVTGHGSYENITRAIEFSALDFITKPIEVRKLKTAIDKVIKRLGGNTINKQVEMLLEHLLRTSATNASFHKKRSMAFTLLKGIIEFVYFEDIVKLEADGVVTHVSLVNGTKLTANRNLGHYCTLLTSEYHFFQISNSILVNLDFVKRYNHSECALTLRDGSTIFASRRGGQDFKRFLEDSREYKSLDQENRNVLLNFLKFKT